MKFFLNLVPFLLFVVVVASCSKTSFITSSDASINFSSDTLHFDTVFTSTGSITQSIKIFNLNSQKLRLSHVQLMGGASSAFKLNVDGTPGVNFSDIELEPNDSVYVFVTVSINPTASNLPFVVKDSIQVNYNGNNRFIQLEAFGKNAHFLRNKRVTRDSTWGNDLPVVILGGLSVDSNVVLTIQKGSRIYAHADAPIVINGSLKVNGESSPSTRVVFTSDRLDPDYADLPGSWPGIFFSSSSINNELTYAVIKNAYQGIITEIRTTVNPKITLNQCIIDNIYDAGIVSFASSIKATNCLISNCGSNIEIAAGGDYSFTHCTVVTFGNLFISHKKPVLSISNAYQNQIVPLNATFTNSIIYGEGGIAENEVLIDKKGNPSGSEFMVKFINVLYKNKGNDVDSYFINSYKNEAPSFDSIDAGRRYFDFHLKTTSKAVNTGNTTTAVLIDLDGKKRDSKPDLGCYER
ncbi:MAG TPA: hypothetical protein VLJ41_15455 [Segetibacter sp.]|nr:hypothetical protein [Segetibacter sp.]